MASGWSPVGVKSLTIWNFIGLFETYKSTKIVALFWDYIIVRKGFYSDLFSIVGEEHILPDLYFDKLSTGSSKGGVTYCPKMLPPFKRVRGCFESLRDESRSRIGGTVGANCHFEWVL